MKKFNLVKEEIEDLKDITNPDILFIGDSYFQLWRQSPMYMDYSFFNLFEKHKALNIGVGSTKFKDWLYLLDEITYFPKFKKIVVNLGFNDIHHEEDTKAEEVYSDYLCFLKKLRGIFPDASIYVLTTVISPLYYSIRNRINYFNSLLRESASQLGVKIIDNAANIDYFQEKENCFIEDGMHLNYFGHKKMSELILKELSISNTPKGRIFSIEEFSIYDGPGIRSTFFLKGCPLSCKWCHNPEGKVFQKQYIRSPNGCLKCNKCLDKAIKVNDKYVLTKESQEACPRNLIKLCGDDYSVDELVNLILKNQEIYKMNNGGVTFSGGEPTLQYSFLIEVCKRLNGKVHVALQTCGYLKPVAFKELLQYVDYVLFDLKIMDNSNHIKYCGVSNEWILENYSTLVKSNVEFITRTPLIPVVIDNLNNLEAIARKMNSLGVKNIELLPYNKYSGSKYSWLLEDYDFDEKYKQVEENNYASIFSKFNIDVKIM